MPEIDVYAKAAHEAWLAEKVRRLREMTPEGPISWPNEHGVEQLVTWDELGEDVREFDRIVVQAIMDQM